jgi:hypothetical protein
LEESGVSHARRKSRRTHPEESGAFPFLAQQLALVAGKHESELSQRDLNDIHEILPREAIPEYSPRNADPVKNRLNGQALENPVKVISTWIRIGARHPIDYASAFLATSMGFWSIDGHINDPGVGRRYIETGFNTDFDPLIERKSKWPALLDLYEKFAGFQGGITRVPILTGSPNEKITNKQV